PTDKIITIESWEGYVIINCAFGLMINKALSRLLGYLISERTGSGVGASQDPYRVFLKTFMNGGKVAEILKNIDAEDVNKLTEISIEKTGLFKRRLLHVAKRFGIIAKDADLSELSLQQLAENLKGTIIWKEALKEISYKDLDIKGLEEIIRKIRKGYFKIVVINEELPLSPISRLGIRKLSWKTDLVPADRLRRIMIESGKARLLNEARVALCCDCFRYVENIRIKNFLNKMNCPNCGSMKIALIDADPKEVLRLASELSDKKKPSERFKKLYKNVIEISELIATYGLPAVMSIAARNLSKPSILKIASTKISDMDFLVDMILREERESLKSRYEKR
ncbi:MAG: hypothetical protein N3D72_04190, partial [Candidatus Methanomethyliaceae archaeon]|nr:hypothetical protein [Candidatus Methanomethyliaceae archaeon]